MLLKWEKEMASDIKFSIMKNSMTAVVKAESEKWLATINLQIRVLLANLQEAVSIPASIPASIPLQKTASISLQKKPLAVVHSPPKKAEDFPARPKASSSNQLEINPQLQPEAKKPPPSA
jgi:hypothetical protein